MKSPFDDVIAEMTRSRYHNHRLETHSDILSNGIFSDLLIHCESLRRDADSGVVRKWLNVSAPGGRGRKVDLFVGEPIDGGGRSLPDLAKLRIVVENKSVITAHRNRDARYDDLERTLEALHRVKPEAVMVGTVLVGTASRVLNVPDRVKVMCTSDEFDHSVLPRLSTGDSKLWEEYPAAISPNKLTDPALTVAKFLSLPVRHPGQTHMVGLDFLLIVPVFVNNVDPPRLDRENTLGIDIDAEYARMLSVICKAYTTRWHP